MDGEPSGPQAGKFSAFDNLLEACQVIGFDWKYLYLNHTAIQHAQTGGKSFVGRTMMEMFLVEAMASHRPYRASLGIKHALEEISANRGRLYDEKIADACLSLFAEKSFDFERPDTD
jgi:hypothetical protein